MRAGAALVLICAACGTPPAAPPDAGPPPDAGRPPPALPALATCPSGWRSVADATGVARCDPFPEGGYRGDCAFGDAHLPGTDGCAAIGTPCAADGWPSDLPTDRPIVFVDDEGTGDGASRAAASGSLADAVAGAPDGAIVAIAAGTYRLSAMLAVDRGQTLWGACPGEVRIVSSGVTGAPLVSLESEGATVRNLGIADAAVGAIGFRSAGVVVRDVAIAGVAMGIFGIAGSASIDGLAIRDLVSNATFPGQGIQVARGASATVSRVAIDRAIGVAIFAAEDGSTIRGSDVIVSDTRGLGHGCDAIQGATLELDRAVVLGGDGPGLAAADRSTLTLRDGVASGMRGSATAPGIFSITAAVASRVVLERVSVLDSAIGAVVAQGVGSSAELRDVAVLDSAIAAVDDARGGVVLADGATATLERVAIVRSRSSGLQVSDAASAIASDVTVIDTRPRELEGTFGRGIDVSAGSRLELTRGLVDGAVEIGLTSITLDVPSEVVLEDVEIRAIRSRSEDGGWGAGIVAVASTLTGRDVRIADVRTEAIGAASGAIVTIDGLSVDGVRQAECAESTCVDVGGGFGVAAHVGGTVTVTSFTIANVALCGVVVATGSAMDLARGVIDRAPVGACVQDDAFDPARLRDEVEYRDVGVPLQATRYQLPDAPVGP